MATNPKRLFDEQLDLGSWFSDVDDVRAWFTEELATTSTGGGGTSYTLTGLAGSYSLSGGSAALTVQRKLTANAGTYSVTGGTATLKVGRKITGNAGSYSLSGGSATLTKTSGSVSYTLTGLSGSYALSGGSASLSVGRKLSGNAGSYSLTGGSATITKSAGAQSYTLMGLTGSYQINGGDADLSWSGEKKGGGYDYDKPKKKRFVVEKGGKLHVYSSSRAAINALDGGDKSQAETVGSSVAPKAQTETVSAPDQSVDLSAIEALARDRQALEHYKAQLAQMQYEALLRLYEDWQEEQDIEDLLAIL